MKKFMLISLSLLVSLSLLTGCGKKKDKNNIIENQGEKNPGREEIKINTNENVIKDQQVETLKFEQTSLIYDGNSVLETLVTNIGTEVVNFTSFKIHVMNDDTQIAELHGFIGDSIKPGESILLSTTYGDDLTMATSIRYEIIR